MESARRGAGGWASGVQARLLCSGERALQTKREQMPKVESECVFLEKRRQTPRVTGAESEAQRRGQAGNTEVSRSLCCPWSRIWFLDFGLRRARSY